MIELEIFKKVRKSFFNSVYVDFIGICENFLLYFFFFMLYVCVVFIIYVVVILIGIYMFIDKEN